MLRMLRLLMLPLLLAASPLQEPAPTDSTEGGAKAGSAVELPDRTLPEIGGETVSLRELAKGGPFLLDFWATWCLPCRQAFPQYAALQERYADHGFRVITVSQDALGAEPKIRALMRRLGVSFPVLQDPDAALAGELGVQHLPTSFLVDQRGTIAWTHVGFLPGDERLVDARLRALFGIESD